MPRVKKAAKQYAAEAFREGFEAGRNGRLITEIPDDCIRIVDYWRGLLLGRMEAATLRALPSRSAPLHRDHRGPLSVRGARLGRIRSVKPPAESERLIGRAPEQPKRPRSKFRPVRRADARQMKHQKRGEPC